MEMETSTSDVQLIRKSEAARLLGISTIAVDRLARAGKLRRVVLGPKTITFVRSEVIKFIQERIAAGAAGADPEARNRALAAARVASAAGVEARRRHATR